MNPGDALGPYRVLDKLGEGGPAYASGRISTELRRGLPVAKRSMPW
jgi:hypothetical protein